MGIYLQDNHIQVEYRLFVTRYVDALHIDIGNQILICHELSNHEVCIRIQVCKKCVILDCSYIVLLLGFQCQRYIKIEASYTPT